MISAYTPRYILSTQTSAALTSPMRDCVTQDELFRHDSLQSTLLPRGFSDVRPYYHFRSSDRASEKMPDFYMTNSRYIIFQRYAFREHRRALPNDSIAQPLRPKVRLPEHNR